MIGIEQDQKKIRYKLVVNTVFWIVFGIITLREDRVLRKESVFDLFLIDLLAPIQSGINSMKFSLSESYEQYFQNVDAKKQLAVLSQKHSELKSKVFSLEQALETESRKNKLMDRYAKLSSRPILGRVIAGDASSDYRILRLNKGLKDGVQIQSPVVTHLGLVGYIYRASDHFSDVLTVLDSKAKIDGQVKRTKSLGIVEGSLGSLCSMKYLRRRDPITLNDTVVTSGLGNIFPAGIPIGYISRIDKQSHGISQKVLIRPAVLFDKLTDVLILSRKFSQNQLNELKKLDKL